MNKAILVAVVVLQVGVGLLALLPGGYTLLKGIDDDPLKLQLTFIGLNFSILALALTYQHYKTYETIKDSTGFLKERQTVVKQLHAWEFYKEFEQRSDSAKSHVSICYFAPYPPDETGDAERRSYYQKTSEVMRRNPRITYRRIVRDTPKNRAWIREFLTYVRTAKNFHVALLPDASTTKPSSALSVQIIDDEVCWLVALASHEPESGTRDLRIENPDIAEAMKTYYNRLWSIALPVWESGREAEHYALLDDIKTETKASESSKHRAPALIAEVQVTPLKPESDK